MFTSGNAKPDAKQNHEIWCCELHKIKWSSKLEGKLTKKDPKQLKTCPSTVRTVLWCMYCLAGCNWNFVPSIFV